MPMTYSFVYFTLLFGHYLLVYLFITSIWKSLVILVRFYKMVPCTFAVLGANCYFNTYFFFFIVVEQWDFQFFRALQLNFERLKHFPLFLLVSVACWCWLQPPRCSQNTTDAWYYTLSCQGKIFLWNAEYFRSELNGKKMRGRKNNTKLT